MCWIVRFNSSSVNPCTGQKNLWRMGGTFILGSFLSVVSTSRLTILSWLWLSKTTPQVPCCINGGDQLELPFEVHHHLGCGHLHVNAWKSHHNDVVKGLESRMSGYQQWQHNEATHGRANMKWTFWYKQQMQCLLQIYGCTFINNYGSHLLQGILHINILSLSVDVGGGPTLVLSQRGWHPWSFKLPDLVSLVHEL